MNLESKILDGKPAGYCSSSEGEEDDFSVVKDEDEHQARVMKKMGPKSNAGAKGVLNDFHSFREQTKRAVEERNLMMLEQAKRGMMVGSKEEREKANKMDDDEDEMSLQDLRASRLKELRKAASNKMIEIVSKEQYSDAVDRSTDYLLCVLIYEPDNEQCEKISYLCKILAADFSKTKFVRATSTLLGMSAQFKEKAVPTLQFYHQKSLVGNFLKVENVIGQDANVEKLKTFLKRNHINLLEGKYDSDSDFSSDDE